MVQNDDAQNPSSEPVNLDSRLRDPFLGEEIRYLESLITLELDDLTHLLVVDEGAVAGEFLISKIGKKTQVKK